jgi:hypothetical protein
MTNRSFDSEEKAYGALEKFKYKTWFCPLINNSCDHTCVCHVPAYIRKNTSYSTPTKTTWTIQDNYCGNEMFFKDELNVNVRY